MSTYGVKIDAKGSCLPLVTPRQSFDAEAYTCNIDSISLSIHNFRDSQSQLQLVSNFATKTYCDALEVDHGGRGRWLKALDDEGLQSLLSVINLTYLPAIDSGLVLTSWHKNTDNKPAMRILFLNLSEAPNTSFGCQVSASQATTKRLFHDWQMPPTFTNLMLGQYVGNHMPASETCSFDEDYSLQNLRFIMQLPRWGYRNRKYPISLFSNHHTRSLRTDYLIVSESDDSRILAIRERLSDVFCSPITMKFAVSNANDPFLVHGLAAHVSFMESDSTIFETGKRLYSTLDQLDEDGHRTFDRESFKRTTFQLHQLSQDLDSLLASADNNIALVRALCHAQQLLRQWGSSKQHCYMYQSMNSSTWLEKAFEVRKRWLQGARARKETAMNLVYHLVTQQDTELNTAIARDTKRDSASMKTIATLTMVFLPSSTVSGFFSMVFFNNTNDTSISISPDMWIFLVVAIPLTMAVFCTWKWWCEIDDLFAKVSLAISQACSAPLVLIRSSSLPRSYGTEKDVELGSVN